METSFTPLSALTGGIIIGLAAVALMLIHGRVLGATGILSGFIQPANTREWRWRLTILIGMLCGPWIYRAIFSSFPVIDVPVSLPMLITGGLIVGFGAAMANGCTSGHGISGIARLSRRSISATATFMATTIATVYIVRHILGVTV